MKKKEWAKWYRNQRLFSAWLRHVAISPGHEPPLIVGGEAIYEIDPTSYEVRCCAPGCDWSYRLEIDDRPR